MSWKITNDKPVYTQLEDEIELRIINGTYTAGTKMLSVRDLASEAVVNPNTMQKALSNLEQKGLIITQRTSGRYVTSDEELILRRKKEYIHNACKDLFDISKRLGITKQELINLINEDEFFKT